MGRRSDAIGAERNAVRGPVFGIGDQALDVRSRKAGGSDQCHAVVAGARPVAILQLVGQVLRCTALMLSELPSKPRV